MINSQNLNYEQVGLKIGLEIHAQLESQRKLFCHCKPELVQGQVPDYVFENGYDLESIEDHSDFMWKNKHLKAVPENSNTIEDGIDIGEQMNGILEELEKAHVYIEQLNERVKELEVQTESCSVN